MTTIGDELRKNTAIKADFVDLMLPDGAVYGWSGIAPFTVDGTTYQPVGAVGGITAVRQSSKIQLNSFNVGLHVSAQNNEAAYQAFMAAVLADRNKDVKGSVVRVYYAVFDRGTGQMIGSLQVRAAGFASRILTDIKPRRTIVTVECEPLIGGAVSATGLHLAQQDQRLLWDDTDSGLDRASLQASNLAITWDPVA